MVRTATALAAIVILVGAGAGAAFATTGPDPYTIVQVKLVDGRIVLSKFRAAHVTFVDFIVHNAGKQPHNFTIGGYKTHPLRPGQTQHLYVGFPVSGKYKFLSTLNATAKMTGWFHVSEPELPD
jgi:hypothetical protein